MDLLHRRTFRLIALSSVLSLVLTACADAADPTTTTAASPSSTTAPSTTLPSTTTTTPAPEPGVQGEIDWFVSVLNGAELSATEYEARFTDGFRTQVPFAQGFLPVLDQFRPLGPFTVVERSGEGASGVATIESADGTRVRIVAEIDDQNRFAALVIQPEEGPTLEDPPDTVDEGFERLGEIGTLRASAAEIVDGSCAPIAGHDEDEPAPIGSIFKLYVLAALGEAVESGEVSWSDEIVIRDELKSVPSGTLQTREAGEVVTVQEAASLMISISDNTAADHLIDLLGRGTIETTMAAYGHTSPDLNTPFMDTREFTALKVGPASGLRIQWIEGNEEARRSILQQISGITTGDLPVQDWTNPIDPHVVEWFASPGDLCRLAAGLLDLAGSVPAIAEILGTNPGVPAEPGTWESIWFKGGSEPGLAAAWFVTRSDGRTFVTSGSVVDPEAVIDTNEAVLLFAAIRDLLAP